MNILSHQDIAGAFDALLSMPQTKTPAPAFDAAAEFAALLASKPAGTATRARPAIAFRDATGAIVQPTVAQYMAGRIDLVAVA